MTPEEMALRIAALEAQQSQILGWLMAMFPILDSHGVMVLIGAGTALLLAGFSVRMAIRALQ